MTEAPSIGFLKLLFILWHVSLTSSLSITRCSVRLSKKPTFHTVPALFCATDPSATACSEDGIGKKALSSSSPDDHIDELVVGCSELPVDASLGSQTNEYSFFDEAIIYVRAGSGGQGASTFKKGVGGQDGPPDGGNGGRGGNVILELDESLNTLAGLSNAWRPNSYGGSGAAIASSPRAYQRKSFRAENGIDGGRMFRSGRGGADLAIRVPPGTIVHREDIENPDGTGRLLEISTLGVENPSVVVARGGEGGEGSGINSRSRGVRRPRTSPQGGERYVLRLTLKIVADVALVGVPNAGKSTFLSAVTRAKPKIANYPFTTVIPNLGVWVPSSSQYIDKDSSGERKSLKVAGGAGSEGLVLCDVPGLISGAAQGVGLGHAFLRHVERCHVILHLVDATSEDPIADFEMLNRELTRYGTGQLARMPQIVAVNKVDALEGKIRSDGECEEGPGALCFTKELKGQLRRAMSHTRLVWISAKEKEGVDALMERMAAFVKKVKAADSAASRQ